MESLLVRLILLAALADIGMSLFDFENCYSHSCVREVEQRSRDILQIDWKPISVFPEEAKRFQQTQIIRNRIKLISATVHSPR